MKSVRSIITTGGLEEEFYINKNSESQIVKRQISDANSQIEQSQSKSCGRHTKLRIEVIKQRSNLERPNWDAAELLLQRNNTMYPKPRAVVYRDRNESKKADELYELHNIIDWTLTRVMESWT
ncbi:hypothetical protein Tco_1041875 [Tanacetum coccineum]|uniref:Uncharacterized protein n=1 Tax=Tanacetum coccineum TaxID=301880 RepID=A0ABQ5GIS1_9ASTR